MKPTKKHYIAYMLPLLLCLLLLVPTFASASAPMEQVPMGYKVIPTEKLELLKSNNDKLLTKLAELEMQIAMLKTPSSELKQQLTEAKTQLIKSQAALRTSNEKLQSAENSLNEMQQSLTKLKEQISFERKAEQRIQKRLRHQRTFAWCVAGVTAMYAVKNH